jgi:hypothetical protein
LALGVAALDAVDIPGDARDGLVALGEFMVNREA